MMIRFMLLVVVLACIGPFFIKSPDGKPLLTLADVLPASEQDEVTPEIFRPSSPEKVTVYKWRDAEGVWQFSDTKVAGTEVESFELDGQVNLLPALEVAPTGQPPQMSQPPASLPDGLTSIGPDKLAEMMEQVNRLQESVDERKTALDNATGNQ